MATAKARAAVVAAMAALLVACSAPATPEPVDHATTTLTQPSGLGVLWQGVPAAAGPSPIDGRFSDVAAFEDGAALAVGTRYTGASRQCASAGIYQSAGATWTMWPHQLPSLPPGVCGGGVIAMSATSEQNVWVLVNRLAPSTKIYHWNGLAWINVTHIGLPKRTTLQDISATPHHVVVVGFSERSPTGRRTVIADFRPSATDAHWNANPTVAAGAMVAVSASSPRSAFAVGNPRQRDQPALVFHWDGESWHQLAAPVVPKASITSVATSGQHDVLVVGGDIGHGYIGGSTGSGSVPEAMHWNGTTWTQPEVPMVAGFLTAVVAAGRHTYWAAGIDQGALESSTYFRLANDVWSAWPGPQRTIPGAGVNQYVMVAAMARVPHTSRFWSVGFDATQECDTDDPCGRAVPGQFVIDRFG